VDDDKLKVPSKTGGDAAHSIAKSGLGAIPVFGAGAAELFQTVLQAPIEKRRDEWMKGVGEKLQELEEQGLNLEDLQNNDQFISATMHASQIALRIHDDERLNALRNAIANIAIGAAPEETLQIIFLEFIDTLSAQHIQILALFENPTPPPTVSQGALSRVIEHNMPHLKGHNELYQQLWKDLYTKGLVNTEGINVMMTGHGLGQKRTTNLGDQFLSFISESQ
jgi:hypothetical protein